jgi:DNA-binding beta-propeller fold protein YncE
MGLFNLFNTPVTQAAPQGMLNRREFIALGGITALTLAGCESSPVVPDAHGSVGGSDADKPVPAHLNAEDGRFVNFPWAPSHLVYCTDRILGVGADRIFDFRPSDSQLTPRLLFSSTGNEHSGHLARQGTGNRYVRTTNLGFYEILLGATPDESSPGKLISFPEPPTGQQNFGGGAVYFGDKLFIALSSGEIDKDYTTVTFGASGTLLVYGTGPDGAVQQGSRRLHPTGGRNPTGLAMIPGTKTLLILNSGPVRNESPASSLVFFDTVSETVMTTIPLNSFRAQLSGDIAVSDDGKRAVIGSSKGSDVLFVDLQARRVADRTSMTGTSFHPSVRIDDSRGVVYVSDFLSGVVAMLNLAKPTLIDSLSLGSKINAGPAVLAGDDLVQSVIDRTPEEIVNGAIRLFPT